MNTDDFKKILDESLEPIKKDLEGMQRSQGYLKDRVGDLQNTVGDLQNTVGDIKDTVEKKVLPSVTYIETNIKSLQRFLSN